VRGAPSHIFEAFLGFRQPLVFSHTLAQLIEAMGVDCVVTLEVHNIVAFQNAFRCRTVHLDTRRLFADRAIGLVGIAPVVVASPDPGGVKRAQLFREMLEAVLARPVAGAYMEKRCSAGVVSGELLVGAVEGATVLVIDDQISTGGTMARAAGACREHGAQKVHALAAHGLLLGEAGLALADPNLSGTVITDTVPPFRLERARRRIAPISASYIIDSGSPARSLLASGISVIVASVSRSTLATETAFSKAMRRTLVGSMIPVATRSTYSLRWASNP
jgi:ribose-phosphate pyrophosphokinase